MWRSGKLAICFGLAAVSLAAQNETRTLHGIVTDQADHTLIHAVVQLENVSTLMVRSCITQAGGRYHFAGLKPDVDYRIMAEYDGFYSARKRLSKFNERKNPEMDLKVQLGK